MYRGDEFLRISRFDNGFSVEIKDPGIVKYNKANDGKDFCFFRRFAHIFIVTV